jgi:lysophospholipase L1-like esterase
MMKKALQLVITMAAFAVISGTWANAQSKKYVYTEASGLTITGKLMTTPVPYHRVDTAIFKGFTKSENNQVRNSSGLAIAFRTNSSAISIKTTYGEVGNPVNTNGISARGYDLYIKKDGKWLFAAAGVAGDGNLDKPFTLIQDMPEGEKECLMYLPTYSEVLSVKIGVDQGASIEPLPNPFRYRIGIFGSSYTHGSSTTRAGMAYPAQFSRETGLQMLSLGCSGNSKLQPYFADVFDAVQLDALVVDAFSNPNTAQIRERLFPFIEKIQAAHPGMPLIIQRTIYRESRNFNMASEKNEAAKMAVADSLMSIACKKYKDVYYIRPNATSPRHDSTVDGVHPDNYGYHLWAESIEKPIIKILAKYGIK